MESEVLGNEYFTIPILFFESLPELTPKLLPFHFPEGPTLSQTKLVYNRFPARIKQFFYAQSSIFTVL